MKYDYIQNIHRVCSGVVGNCFPWKIIDGKSVHLPPIDQIKIAYWGEETIKDEDRFDLIVALDAKCINEKISRHCFNHTKIFAVLKEKENRYNFLIMMYGFGIVIVDEKEFNDRIEFVFRPPTKRKEPIWEGQRKCTILVHSGAGFGDEFHAGRHILPLKEKYDVRVIFEARPEMYRFMKFCSHYDDVIYKGQNSEFDFQMNLEQLLKKCTSVRLPCYFVDDKVELNQDKINIAIAYRGGFVKYRKQRFFNPDRLKILNCQTINVYSVQKIYDQFFKPKDIDWCEDLSDKISDWYDTARYLSSMHYMLTPDTALMHLSCCLGIKTKVFLEDDHINSYIRHRAEFCASYPGLLVAYWGSRSLERAAMSVRIKLI
jgi:hypothetical protein